jgi:hypothetical protein
MIEDPPNADSGGYSTEENGFYAILGSPCFEDRKGPVRNTKWIVAYFPKTILRVEIYLRM